MWENGEEKREIKKKNGGFPPLWVLGGPFCLLDPQLEDFSQLFLSATPCPLLGFHLPRIQTERYWKIKKIVNSLSVWWYFRFWSSSSSCMLLFTFQSPQIVAPCLQSILCSCIQRERQGEVCLLHLTWNQNWNLTLRRPFVCWVVYNLGWDFIHRNTGMTSYLGKGIS